jgi:cell division protein FtsQ
VSEDPRISTRRRDVRRSKLRRRLWIAGGVLGVLALAAGSWFVLHSSWFSAKTITVEGNAHESHAAVIAAAGLESHPPLISIDEGAASAGVERLAWVKTARITVRWPSTVEIRVVDRQPVGTVPAPGRWLLVDATGRVLAHYSTIPFGQLRIVVPPPLTAAVGAQLGPKAQPAVSVAASLPPAFRGQVTAVVGHSDGTVSLRMDAPVSVDLGTATQLRAKYEDVAAVIAGTALHAGDVLDVSVPQASTITGS